MDFGNLFFFVSLTFEHETLESKGTKTQLWEREGANMLHLKFIKLAWVLAYEHRSISDNRLSIAL